MTSKIQNYWATLFCLISLVWSGDALAAAEVSKEKAVQFHRKSEQDNAPWDAAEKVWADLMGEDAKYLKFENGFHWSYTPPKDKMGQIPAYLKNLPPDTLVVLDAFGMETPKDTITSSEKINAILNKLSREEAGTLACLVPSKSICPELPNLVTHWLDQKDKVRVVAVTELSPGPCGRFPRREENRIQHMQGAGYPLEQFWKDVPRMTLNFSHPKKVSPVFQEGVLFCGDFKESEVLEEFIRTQSWKPNAILFLRTFKKDSNLMDKNIAKNLNLNSLTVHCLKAADEYFYEQQRPLTPYEKKRGEFQVDQFRQAFKNHRYEWLSDNQADALLKTTPALKSSKSLQSQER